MISELTDALKSLISAQMESGFLTDFVSLRTGPPQVLPTPEQPAILLHLQSCGQVVGAAAHPQMKLDFGIYATCAPTTTLTTAATMTNDLLWRYEDGSDKGLLPFLLYIQGKVLDADSMGRRFKIIVDTTPSIRMQEQNQNIIGAIFAQFSAISLLNS